jgi:hypothetical protein
MKRLLPYLNRMWETDVALTALLIFLILYFFLLFPMGQISSLKLMVNLFFSLILISGVIAATKNRVFRTIVFSWGILLFFLLWVRHLFPYRTLTFVTIFMSLTFLVLLAFLILGQVFREGPTTSHRITGAVVIYLLLGLIWSLAYQLIAFLVPDAFSIQGAAGLSNKDTLQSHLFYFSFITLTTLGYGDIVPVHPMARLLVILEGVTGQLFPAILIAQLVASHTLEAEDLKI